MTAYHGGKQRIGKQLAEIIVDESIDIAEEEGFEIKGYCEPFCGMLGVFRHIPELFEDAGLFRLKYKAGDTNESVIKMWKAAVDGWCPPTKCTKREYENLKKSEASPVRGYIGHQYSFGGQFFKGYAPLYGKSPVSTAASNRVQKIAEKVRGVEFSTGDYNNFSRLNNYVIYCDPPYSDTENRYAKKFDSEKFWDWCRKMSTNNIVFVSEYKAPKDIESIFQSSHRLTGDLKLRTEDKRRTERLYVL